jgi:hypothetical protein
VGMSSSSSLLPKRAALLRANSLTRRAEDVRQGKKRQRCAPIAT